MPFFTRFFRGAGGLFLRFFYRVKCCPCCAALPSALAFPLCKSNALASALGFFCALSFSQATYFDGPFTRSHFPIKCQLCFPPRLRCSIPFPFRSFTLLHQQDWSGYRIDLGFLGVECSPSQQTAFQCFFMTSPPPPLSPPSVEYLWLSHRFRFLPPSKRLRLPPIGSFGLSPLYSLANRPQLEFSFLF